MLLNEWVIYKRSSQDIECIIYELQKVPSETTLSRVWKFKKRQYIKYTEIAFPEKILNLQLG